MKKLIFPEIIFYGSEINTETFLDEFRIKNYIDLRIEIDICLSRTLHLNFLNLARN